MIIPSITHLGLFRARRARHGITDRIGPTMLPSLIRKNGPLQLLLLLLVLVLPPLHLFLLRDPALHQF
jgi:hypothetical protein